MMVADSPGRDHSTRVLPRSLAPVSAPMRQALASVRVEGLEPDAEGMDLIRRVDCGEITTEQAIETYASQFIID